MKKFVICDIDGTLANIDHRVHFLKDKPIDWEAFYRDTDKDKLIKPIAELVHVLSRTYQIVFLTGRSENEREMTISWLRSHNADVNNSELIMRKKDDHRGDQIVKLERAMEEGLVPQRVAFVLEDRNRVVKAWREAGYTCLQVAEGDF